MARTSDDTWDLSESVGVTALGAADARARETSREDPLILIRTHRCLLTQRPPAACSTRRSTTSLWPESDRLTH